MTALVPEFRRQIPGSYSEIHPLGEAIAEWADSQGVPARVVNSVLLMLDELLTNVVMHGYGDSGQGRIEVLLRLDTESVEAVIRDSAHAFDPFSIPAPDTALPPDERPIGGLGVHFVRTMSDGFGYRRDGEMNEVRLRKRLAS